MPYFTGSVVPLSFPLVDQNGNPVNTSGGTVTCTVTLPDQTTVSFTGTPTSGQISNPATGTYQVTAGYTTTESGHHTVAWTATGSNPGAFTDAFDTLPAGESAILSFADAKRTLRIPTTDTQEDDFVREFNEATTGVIEWLCGPVIVQNVVEELRVGGLTVLLSKPPVISLTAWTSVPSQFSADTTRVVPSPPSPMFPVMVYGVTFPLSQLYCDPRRGEVRHTSGIPFYYGPFLWQYQAGRAMIPQVIINASRALLRHLYGMERGGMVGGTGIGMADEETTMTPFGFAIPNRVIEELAPEALPGAIA